VILGLRPSTIAIDSNLANADAGIIQTIEPLGDFLDVQVQVNSTTLLARVPARRGLRPSARVPIYADLTRALLFESDPHGSRISCEIRDDAPLTQECIA
jgi:ABC-type sugar transport system ATPase subunit